MPNKKILELLKNFLFISLPTFIVLFLFLEFVVFRFVLPASQLPSLEFDKEYLILKPSLQGPKNGFHSMGQWTKNASKWQLNNFGWVNTKNYEKEKKRPRLAIIGDSFVMGLEVNTEETFSVLLGEKYRDSMDVYSFGMAGSPLSNYLYMARYVIENFDPDILLINVVFNDFKGSIYDYSPLYLRNRFWTYKITNDSLFKEIPPDTLSLGEGRLNSLLRSCAIGRYLYHNIKITHLRSYFRKRPAESRIKKTVELSEYDQHELVVKAVEKTLNKIKFEFPDKRIIFTLDGLRREIKEGVPLEGSKLNRNRLMLKELCELNDIEFIDLSIPFLDDYRKNGENFGFKIDPHWNSYGHNKVAEAIYNHLSGSIK